MRTFRDLTLTISSLERSPALSLVSLIAQIRFRLNSLHFLSIVIVHDPFLNCNSLHLCNFSTWEKKSGQKFMVTSAWKLRKQHVRPHRTVQGQPKQQTEPNKDCEPSTSPSQFAFIDGNRNISTRSRFDLTDCNRNTCTISPFALTDCLKQATSSTSQSA